MIRDTKIIRQIIKFIITFSFIGCFWIGLEYLLDGQIMPSYSDTIIGIIISLHISKNHLFINGE